MKLKDWIGWGSKATVDIAYVNHQPPATVRPTPIAPAHPQGGTRWRRAQTTAASSHRSAKTRAPP